MHVSKADHTGNLTYSVVSVVERSFLSLGAARLSNHLACSTTKAGLSQTARAGDRALSPLDLQRRHGSVCRDPDWKLHKQQLVCQQLHEASATCS